MILSRTVALVLAFALLNGCASTHMVGLPYQPTVTTVPIKVGSGGVRIGTFEDRRGTDPRWVGAVRGKYGNIVKRLFTDQTTAEVVQQSLVDALRARHVESATGKADVWIEGQILKLDCSYLFNREAHAHLLIRVLSASRSVLYTQTYRTDNEEAGRWAGRFADVDTMAQLERRTLNQTVDKMFADPLLVDALGGKQPPHPRS